MATKEEEEAFREVMKALGDAVYTTIALAMRTREGGKSKAIEKWVAFGDKLRAFAEEKD